MSNPSFVIKILIFKYLWAKGWLGKSLSPKSNHQKCWLPCENYFSFTEKNNSQTNECIIGKTDSINHLVFSFYSDLSPPRGMSSVKMCGELPVALFPLFLFGLCGPWRRFLYCYRAIWISGRPVFGERPHCASKNKREQGEHTYLSVHVCVRQKKQCVILTPTLVSKTTEQTGIL